MKSLETTITAGNRPSSPKQAEPEKPPPEPIKEEKGGKGKNAKKAKVRCRLLKISLKRLFHVGNGIFHLHNIIM